MQFSTTKKSLLATGVILAVAGGLLLAFSNTDLKDLSEFAQNLREQIHYYIGSVHPLTYWIAFILLPLFGCPQSIFYLTVVTAVGGGNLALGLLAAWTAILCQMVMSSLLARHILHRLITWVIQHRHLSIPKFSPHNEWQIVLAVRLSPIPFIVQNYLLALGHANWKTYYFLSFPIQALLALGMIFLGDSFFSGNVKYALFAIFLILVVSIVGASVRKRASLLDLDQASDE